jgi:transposase
MSCFRTRGKKGEDHCDPADPPRRRANKRRGRGTSANDRPPIVGPVGRESGQVRLRVLTNTNGAILCEHVHQFTQPNIQVYTDEAESYHRLSCHQGMGTR